MTYIIHQHPTGDILTGVYITDLDFGLFGAGNRPGNYHVQRTDNRWSVDKTAEGKIDTRNAAINGLAGSLDDAGEDIMPPMVEWAYGQLGENREKLRNEGFTLFYNPQSIMIEGTMWKTPEQKQTNGRHVAKLLARQLKMAQTQGQAVQWTIHGNGCQVLQQALEQMPGQPLDKHTLMFMAPEGRLDHVLPLARKAGMKLHDEVMLYSEHETSVSKYNNTTGYARQLGAEVAAFGGVHDRKGKAIASQGRNVLHGALLYAVYTGLSLGSSLSKTAISFAVPAILPEQRHMLRNRLASLLRLNDHRINPHHSPHLSGAEFNQKVLGKTGGMGRSYGLTFKTLLKKIRS